MHMEQATYNESSILVFYTRIDMQLHNVFIILGTHYFSLSGKTSYERKQKQAKILCSLLNHALFCLGGGGEGKIIPMQGHPSPLYQYPGHKNYNGL